MALPSVLVAGQVPGIAWLNAILAEQTAWTASKNGGGFNLSNVGTLTFTTLGGNVDVASKNLSNLGLVTFGAGKYINGFLGVKVAPGAYQFYVKDAGFVNQILESTDPDKGALINFVTTSDSSSGWACGKRDDLLSGTAAGSFVVAKGASVYFSLNPSGQPRFFAMPTSSAGLASGALWRDPAATTKTAGASYTANEQAMLNEIKAYLASVVKQVP